MPPIEGSSSCSMRTTTGTSGPVGGSPDSTSRRAVAEQGAGAAEGGELLVALPDEHGLRQGVGGLVEHLEHRRRRGDLLERRDDGPQVLPRVEVGQRPGAVA
jgi:hypothetical protein